MTVYIKDRGLTLAEYLIQPNWRPDRPRIEETIAQQTHILANLVALLHTKGLLSGDEIKDIVGDSGSRALELTTEASECYT